MSLYLKHGFNWDAYSTSKVLCIVFGVIFLLVFSCSMVLELIQQLETGEKMNLSKAFARTLAHNVIKIIPLVIIWFVLTVIQALLSKKRRGGSEKDFFSAENAVKTLAGYQSSSLSRAFFESLKKGVRLILPAIVWENMGFWKATKKGAAVIQSSFIRVCCGFCLN